MPPALVRRITCGGVQFELNNLGVEIDAAFDALHQQAVNGVIQWPDFNAAVVRLVATGPNDDVMNLFFSNATTVWKLLMAGGAYQKADGVWERVLDSVVKAETSSGTRVHKGTGYYFWGLNSLTCGDTDRGLLLVHEALVEDRETSGVGTGVWPDTPAAKLVTLGAGQHPASWWVADQHSILNQALGKIGSPLRAEDIHQRFFLKTDPSNTYLFVQAHAALVRLERTPAPHRDNKFVGRVILSHLFHMAVVIERAVAARSGKTGLFKVQAECLSKKVGGELNVKVPPSNTRAGDINAQMKAGGGPDRVLRGLLASTFTYSDGASLHSQDRPIGVTYAVRNLGAHDTDAPSVVWQQPADLREALVGCLATCVTAYYP